MLPRSLRFDVTTLANEVIGRCCCIRIISVLRKVFKNDFAIHKSFEAPFRSGKFIVCSMDFPKSTTKS